MLLALPFGFLFGFVGSMPLAGPVALLVFGRGLRGAWRSGTSIALGSAIAESGYAFLAYWGVGELLQRFPSLVLASRGAAALILGGLGLYFVLHRPPEARGGAQPEHVRSSFALGLGITALNPTFLATWTAAVAVLHSTRLLPATAAGAAPFALGVGSGILGWFLLMLWLMRRYRDRFRPRTLTRVLQAVGVALLGMGVWGAVGFARGVATAAGA